MKHETHITDAAKAAIEAASLILTDDAPHLHDPVVGPIYQTSLFTFKDFAEMQKTFAGEGQGYIYSRVGNPTVHDFERRIAELEGAEAARAFSSGMAAISSTVLSIVSSGDRIVAVRHCYGDAYRFFEKLLPRFNITVDYVDGSDADAVEAALPGAKLLYLESPSSMVFELQDIKRLAQAARAQGITTVIDNSWATPVFQKPHTHGVDLVLHSASKYIGGHSDTVAGVVAGSKALIARINELTHPFLGAKLSPLEAFLLIRGLRTLPFRLKRHMDSALFIAERLRAHAHVTKIHHPIYSNHPGRATLAGFTGLFTFEVDDTIDIPRFTDLLKFFRLGVSWGGHESLIVPVAASLAQTPGVNSFDRFSVSPRAIRLHVGLEDPEMLWADLENALAKSIKT
ncbi:PLP-dependent transferase [Taklimakanibacter albus]|uniref:PLP-dependent transferase n=1 Tax=Taklimakanibacter albus TaxID=2800327 RepID=A0ACC5RB73_9HYPH|nr:PLP-dependent transferase [Aestuariivirga sp. YIM B02566]MBK1869852.1 PLP-dependent transferase [Aestuariivirga sp. YIM B02566]